jgi:hypothetical protein
MSIDHTHLSLALLLLPGEYALAWAYAPGFSVTC